LSITKLSFGTNPYIGAYLRATDKYVLAPPEIKPSAIELIAKTLKVPVIKVHIGNSSLLGVFTAANSNGLILPDFATDDDIKMLKRELPDDINIIQLPTKYNAIGNLIITNDHGAICSPVFDDSILKLIEDALNVEIIRKRIVSSDIVGTIGVATNKGALFHPLTTDDELELISNVLHVPVDIGTVNLGSPYIAIGLVANSNGALVGSETTGPEIVKISHALNIVETE